MGLILKRPKSIVFILRTSQKIYNFHINLDLIGAKHFIKITFDIRI